MKSGVLLWANARCIEDLESVGGGREEEKGADFGSLTPCLQPRSGKSLWRWRESRPGPLWPSKGELEGEDEGGLRELHPVWLTAGLCGLSCTCERVSRCENPRDWGSGGGEESRAVNGSCL